MGCIIRRSIAFEKKDLSSFDRFLKKKGYKNRSEAIRNLIRESLVEEQQKDPERRMMATLTIVYNHHDHDAQHRLTHVQHHAGALVRSTLHVHVDEENCLEVLLLEGKVKEIKKLADAILATKGVKHSKLVLTSV